MPIFFIRKLVHIFSVGNSPPFSLSSNPFNFFLRRFSTPDPVQKKTDCVLVHFRFLAFCAAVHTTRQAFHGTLSSSSPCGRWHRRRRPLSLRKIQDPSSSSHTAMVRYFCCLTLTGWVRRVTIAGRRRRRRRRRQQDREGDEGTKEMVERGGGGGGGVGRTSGQSRNLNAMHMRRGGERNLKIK